MEMKDLRDICGVKRTDRTRKARKRNASSQETNRVETANKAILRWYERLLRMNDGRLDKMVFMFELVDIIGEGVNLNEDGLME